MKVGKMKEEQLADESLARSPTLTMRENEVCRNLRESEERYRSLVSAIAQIVWTINGKDHSVRDLSAWCSYTGQNAAEMDDEAQMWSALHPNDQERVILAWRETLALKKPCKVEFRLRSSDAHYRFFSMCVIPVFDEGGGVREWIGICTDISERKQREEEYARSLHGEQQVLRETMHRMEEFLCIASHELRTPLTTIKANVQLAMRRLKAIMQLNDELSTQIVEKTLAANDMLGRAERQIAVLNRLVGDMLDISRIQTGRLDSHLRQMQCDLLAIVREALQEQQGVMPGRVVLFETSVDKELGVIVDRARIQQVVENYINNALKYSEVDKPVLVRVDVEGQRARVSVHDQGQGLSPDEQRRIWECFYQSPEVKVLSGSAVGMGIGLCISQVIIEHYQGQVGVDSQRGKGSTFWFTLPLVSVLQ